jgi:hypothetical protein
MGYCVLCEKEKAENWFGSFCPTCRKLKNIGNVYGFERVYNILEKCCIRNEAQLEKKIESHKKEEHGDESYEKPKTRSKAEKI